MDIEFAQSQIANIGASQQVAGVRVIPEQTQETVSGSGNDEAKDSVNVQRETADKENNRAERPATAELEAAVVEISDFVQAQNRNLNFSFDEGSNRSVVKVTDSESGDLIRQIPSEEVLRLSGRIKELQSDVGVAVGILFNKEV